MENEPPTTDILLGVINRFIGLFSRQIQHHTKNETTREYPFVAMDTRQVFQELLLVADYVENTLKKEPSSLKFLDIGCGFGNVLLFAEQFGFNVYGLEKDEASLKIAREFFEEYQLIKEDLRTYKGYKEFDIVYYFCPLTEGEREFERYLEDEITPGTILIANYKRSKEIFEDRRFKRLSSSLPVWQKISQ